MALLALFASIFLPIWFTQSAPLSLNLVHRLSAEARTAAPAGYGGAAAWPSRGSVAHCEALMRSDLQRQKRRLGSKFEALYPYEGSQAFSLGNDFGWLHYTWIDVGTPNVSFLVALDSGSDLLWVPCNCIQCAPLSGYQSSLEKDMGMYDPSESTTSRHLACGHELCDLGPTCQNQKQPCPYNVSYYTEDTYSSGLLVQDTIYFASSAGKSSIQASVVIGCGRRQGGGYLDGIAPDGLLGLGLGQVSVPSFLSRDGLVKNSFSLCFKDDDSGRIYFGDQGASSQKSTPFLPLNGKIVTYIIEIDKFCVGHKCIEQSGLQALFDSGSSFTFVPQDVYKRVSVEFDRQVGAARADFDGYPFEYCYKTSTIEMHDIPSLALNLAVNKSFLVINPIYRVYEDQGQIAGFCFALQSSPDSIATIGQNFMTGYRLVFDRENLKLGWSQSNCDELENGTRVPLTPKQSNPNPNPNQPENPLPTNEQQSSPDGQAVTPAMAGKAPTNPNYSFSLLSSLKGMLLRFYFLLILAHFTLVS